MSQALDILVAIDHENIPPWTESLNFFASTYRLTFLPFTCWERVWSEWQARQSWSLSLGWPYAQQVPKKNKSASVRVSKFPANFTP